MPRIAFHLTLLALTLTLCLAAFADEPNEPSDNRATEPAAAPAPAAPTAPPADALDRTMQELQDLRQTAPGGEPAPAPQPGVEYVPSRVGAPAVSVDIDRSVLGVAPGQPLPTLRREGEFIVRRRGRLVRSPDGAHVLLRFEADSDAAPEPPMIMQACRNLQAMEDYVSDRGDTTVFIVSGQVHVYRGANYLLPTMWQLAHDQGNLQP